MRTPRRLLAGLALLGGLGLAGCGSAHPAPSSSPSAAAAPSPAATQSSAPASSAPTTSPPRPRPKRHASVAHPSGPDPGTLPQTAQLPSSDTPAFHAEMTALWSAISTGSAELGRAAFFPETAYAQIKDLADPAADFQDRLFADFRLDVGAAHALLGGSAARLVAVQVPASYVHWVPPGVCYNRFGYYEVPNARVVYDQAGQTRSFGIASMISWRGVWYVVHLGAVLRPGTVGVVDAPSAGTGTPVPSSTC